ncbi:MAG UNVERIFIED_CONTAM: MFS transporter [Planctomycetaceae bacterium]|jgi:acyl-[acyl-carrier-protein]-phospholipid O-acyltransferase/long-chain-fatty-acid--[acyl-carrier-protein] ligase
MVSSVRPEHGVGGRAFFSFLTAQFLGAFNDNYFKQLVLLVCVTASLSSESEIKVPWKEIAMAVFALPFVMFSGVGGFLSDRCSKRTVIVGCKVAEIAIVCLSLGLLLIPGLTQQLQLSLLIAMLGLMGTHSAIFSPSKYGILPELFREDQLRPVNGAVQMTTFLAIIFGMVAAGIALDEIGGRLWIGSLLAVIPAVLGTLTAALIPGVPAAEPELRFRSENFFLPGSVAEILWSNRGLRSAIAVSALFWFLGGVTQMSVTTLGEQTLKLSSTRSSVLAAGMGIGIAAGCVTAGFLGRPGSGGGWTVAGAWLLVVSMSLVALLGSGIVGVPASSGVEAATEAIWQRLLVADSLEWGCAGSMVLLGFAAGIFVVPVQVYLQQAPPAEVKGRLLGVQNLATWIGILFSAAYSWLVGTVLRLIGGESGDERLQWAMFLTLAVMLVPVGLFYRLPERVSQESR